MAWDSGVGAYVDATGLARGNEPRVTAIWPDQEAQEAKHWVSNKALRIFVVAKVWPRCPYRFQ